MQILRGKLDGPVTFHGDMEVHGMINGSATVTTGCSLVLHGMVCGDLVVELNARADVHGTVGGNVLNRGGELRVSGTVHGLLTREAGTTEIVPGAVLIGGVL